MSTVAIVQARMGSTRLPGKVLMSLGGPTMLDHVVERLGRAKSLDAIVVATTQRPEDDIIASHLKDNPSVGIFRGDAEDVLRRYRDSAHALGARTVVRITADCPLIDPEVVDRCVLRFLSDPSLDYLSNTLTRTFPRGLDTEVFRIEALERAHQEAVASADREHVTPYLWRHPDLFKLGELRAEQDHSAHRWTVDTPEDFAFVQRIFDALWPEQSRFAYRDVLRLLEQHPDWAALNRDVVQKPI